jgi:glycosyltransferase involved in cell wall biosynthesis
MKIVAIAGSRVPSDTANSIQVMKACSALTQLGHDLTLIVPENNVERSTFNVQQHYGINTSFPIEWLSGSSRRFFTINSVRRALKLKPDLLYVWMPQSAVFGLLARIPTIFEIHIQPSGLLGPTWHRAFAKLPGHKRLACITQAMQWILETDYHMTMRPADVIIAPNGVELERFASLPDPEWARQTLGLRDAPTVLCAGHLYAGRGADLFLQLAESARDASFVWVGGRPDDVEEWSGKAKARGLTNVTFLGFVPNIELPRYLAAADVLLMPYARSIFGSSGTADSASIASPMKMFEYMAAGRAILTSDLPVIREVLNESSAVFCEPGDAAAWSSALKRLLDDPARRMSLASNARRKAEKYTWLARAQKILAGFLESGSSASEPRK